MMSLKNYRLCLYGVTSAPLDRHPSLIRRAERIEVQCAPSWDSTMKLLDLLRRPKVAVEVAGDVLVVTMPGTTFSITYEKTDENQLVASPSKHGSFHTKRGKSPFQNFSASRG